MNRQLLVAVAFLGLAACTTSGTVPDAKVETPAISGDPTATEGLIGQVGAVEEEYLDPDELICTKERLTGSRIPTKICLTRAERDKIRETAQGNFDAERRKPGANPSE